MGVIHLRCKVFPMAFLLYLCKVKVSIDNGYEQIVRWGENTLNVPPGRHHLRVWYNYITGPTNVGDLVVDVPEGQPVRVVYKTRWMIFLPGKVEIEGFQPQHGMHSGGYGGAASGGYPQAQQTPAQGYQAQQAVAHGQSADQAGQAGQAGPPPGWNPDPVGRHEHRWWDGQKWTSAVADRGVTSDDPI
jgi:hypothetical protein